MFGFDYIITIDPIDLNIILEWAQLPLPLFMWELIRHGGWLLVFFILVIFLKDSWLNNLNAKYDSEKKKILLAIDVPRENEQTPKAAEHIFSTLSSLEGSPSWLEKYRDGFTPDVISLEIVSIDGYVQFLIHCNEAFRDIIEATLYAQYPDVEITEVSDYTETVPQRFPSEEYKMFGLELKNVQHSSLPIRTYEEFEHGLTQELKDPLASLIENMTRVQIGEQVWLQILISPIDDSWREDYQAEIDSFLNRSKSPSQTTFEKIALLPFTLVLEIIEKSLTALGMEMGILEPSESDITKLSDLTPGEKEKLTAMERKISKIGFDTSIRLVYVSKKEVFSKLRGIAAVLGSIRQYNSLNLNGFQPDGVTATKAGYFFESQRVAKKQNKLLKAYSNRELGNSKFILNTEELATIYHFPDITIKTPLLKRTAVKRSEAPIGLPIHLGDDIIPGFEQKPKKEDKKKKSENEEIFKAPSFEELEDKKQKEIEEIQNYFSSEDENISLPVEVEENIFEDEPIEDAAPRQLQQEISKSIQKNRNLSSSGNVAARRGSPPSNLPVAD